MVEDCEVSIGVCFSSLRFFVFYFPLRGSYLYSLPCPIPDAVSDFMRRVFPNLLLFFPPSPGDFRPQSHGPSPVMLVRLEGSPPSFFAFNRLSDKLFQSFF